MLPGISLGTSLFVEPFRAIELSQLGNSSAASAPAKQGKKWRTAVRHRVKC